MKDRKNPSANRLFFALAIFAVLSGFIAVATADDLSDDTDAPARGFTDGPFFCLYIDGESVAVTLIEKSYSGSITIPETAYDGYNTYNVTQICDYAFKNCTELTSVTISGSIEDILTGAFEGCTKLTSITIPDNVQKIGSGAFLNCSSLKTVLCCSEEAPAIQSNVFEGCHAKLTVRVPSGCVTEYQTKGWSMSVEE